MTSERQESSLEPHRTAQELIGGYHARDLEAEIEHLRAEEPFKRTGKHAMLMVKTPDLRVVLTAMKAGSHIWEYKANGRITVQTMSGHLVLRLPEQWIDLPAGNLVVLDAGIRHDVEAREDSVYLLHLME